MTNEMTQLDEHSQSTHAQLGTDHLSASNIFRRST